MDTSRFRAMLLLALVFAAGAVVGVAADRFNLAVAADQAGESEDGGPGESDARGGDRRGGQTAIEEFADELGLTPEQRSQIEGFLDHYREGARSLREAVRPRYGALMDSVRTQIESVLTEEQVEGYRDHLRLRYGGGRDRERGPTDGSDSGRND
ncbi:hypothetical protein [Candidatus Palauibacter sp.]|uniref:hypothetical protein n=1 Tax=Candidatus Palauibacter sp. TaxID=3101350 RepID=UPI003AF30DFB